jgi:hypothetical protein
MHDSESRQSNSGKLSIDQIGAGKTLTRNATQKNRLHANCEAPYVLSKTKVQGKSVLQTGLILHREELLADIFGKHVNPHLRDSPTLPTCCVEAANP